MNYSHGLILRRATCTLTFVPPTQTLMSEVWLSDIKVQIKCHSMPSVYSSDLSQYRQEKKKKKKFSCFTRNVTSYIHKMARLYDSCCLLVHSILGFHNFYIFGDLNVFDSKDKKCCHSKMALSKFCSVCLNILTSLR